MCFVCRRCCCTAALTLLLLTRMACPSRLAITWRTVCVSKVWACTPWRWDAWALTSLAMCAVTKGFSSEARQRNRVRQRLTSFFKDRDCVTLVRPIIDEDKLQVRMMRGDRVCIWPSPLVVGVQNVDKLPFESLRPEFREGIDTLKDTIYSRVRLRVFPR